MPTSKAFGNVLKKWRLARELTQEKLAHGADLDRTFISFLERGLRQPTLSTIFALSKVLKVEPADLVRQTQQKLSSRARAQRRRL